MIVRRHVEPMRFRWFVAMLTIVAASSAGFALAEDSHPGYVNLLPTTTSTAKRIALVIGNAAYRSVPQLKNPTADAQAVATKLQEVGFSVILAKDVDRREMNEAIDNFLSRIEPGSDALVYYSGHGVEMGGSNYLLPVDIPVLASDQERTLKSEGVNLTELLLDLESHSARVNLVILDACRDNPFQQPGSVGRTKSLGSQAGLGKIDAPEGTFVMFAAGVGQQAIDSLGDSDKNPNGLFTRELLAYMDKPNLEIREMVQQLRAEVRQISLASGGGPQTPSYYDQLLGQFYFRTDAPQPGPRAVAALSPESVTPAANPPPPPKQAETKVAAIPKIDFWTLDGRVLKLGFKTDRTVARDGKRYKVTQGVYDVKLSVHSNEMEIKADETIGGTRELNPVGPFEKYRLNETMNSLGDGTLFVKNEYYDYKTVKISSSWEGLHLEAGFSIEYDPRNKVGVTQTLINDRHYSIAFYDGKCTLLDFYADQGDQLHGGDFVHEKLGFDPSCTITQ